MKATHLLPLLGLLSPLTSAWGASSSTSSSSNSKKILLSKVSTLTLRSGQQTSHRRVPSIPQLKCVSPSHLCNLYEIDTVRCFNAGAGYDNEDVQWTCTATVPEELKLGRTDVICEGYSGPDDKYVLKGSCGVEYTMHLTDKGRERYPGMSDGNGVTGWTWGGVLFAVVFVAVLGWIVYSACVAGRQNGQMPRMGRPQRRFGGGNFWPGGGGGGGGPGGWNPGWGPGAGNNDPPPPYPGTQQPPKTNNGQQQEQGWQPGFWSGLAGGAAAGYMAGQGRNYRQDNYRNRHEWGHDNHRNYGSTWGRSGSRSSDGSSTGATHEATGFGSTSRR
ncbi:hypothetical protein MKZ38_002757 [Zalerion maritima]|uniref:Store-operated calcium entry-associated regulatory factor n=1 Tax=Zalerion maritima TaxID=339359 RepID=A0AAD5WR19_9PEZI|nr:hypothetical protein MKZ38_002757 [Zalerion maritima]